MDSKLFKPIKYLQLNNERNSWYMLLQINSQNLVKTLRIFHKTIHKSKKYFAVVGLFPRCALNFLWIDFASLIRTLQLLLHGAECNMGNISWVCHIWNLFHEPLGEWSNSKIWEMRKIFANIAQSNVRQLLYC